MTARRHVEAGPGSVRPAAVAAHSALLPTFLGLLRETGALA
jgi:hypothetical protein